MLTLAFNKEFLHAAKKISDVLKVTYKYYRQTKVAAKGHKHIAQDDLFKISKAWAHELVEIAGFKLSTTGEAEVAEPCIFVGNHISYLDIATLMTAAPAVFVAKNEIKKWPLFGNAAKVSGTMFVKRGSKKSRKKTYDLVGEAILKRKQSVIIFPSGTTCLDETKEWRWGAFEIAKKFAIPMQPFRLTYNPLRASAFVGHDLMIPHMLKLFGHKEIKIKLEFGKSFLVKDVKEDCERVRLWTQEFLQHDKKPAKT